MGAPQGCRRPHLGLEADRAYPGIPNALCNQYWDTYERWKKLGSIAGINAARRAEGREFGGFRRCGSRRVRDSMHIEPGISLD
jgi:hypothetical protein